MFLRIAICYNLLFWLCLTANAQVETMSSNSTTNDEILKTITIDKTVSIENYFEFMDSIVSTYGSSVPYQLSEHLLVSANPWIIDTLKNTDYYVMKARDSFVYDQKKMIVFHKGDLLGIPNSRKANLILNNFKNTTIDINVPEFKLRIYEDSTERFSCMVRVGRNEKKYLEMAGRLIDLRTKTGKGYVVGHVKDPDYYNPVNNHQYFVTKRDDEVVTKLPQIPFIETEINGVRNGQLIHPTTNPMTLGKAYSNGCIGTSEADAWVIYYNAPVGTKVTIRYDLNIIDEDGKNIILSDIYGLHKISQKKP